MRPYRNAFETASFDFVADACRSLLEIYPQIRLNFYDDNEIVFMRSWTKGTLDFALVFTHAIPAKYKMIQLPRKSGGVLVPKNPLDKARTSHSRGNCELSAHCL